MRGKPFIHGQNLHRVAGKSKDGFWTGGRKAKRGQATFSRDSWCMTGAVWAAAQACFIRTGIGNEEKKANE
jgi:hypothetical protein